MHYIEYENRHVLFSRKLNNVLNGLKRLFNPKPEMENIDMIWIRYRMSEFWNKVVTRVLLQW